MNMQFKLWLETRDLDKVKIDQFGPYKIFLVNAAAIRDKSVQDDEFNHIGIHLEFPSLIPDKEIWISKDIDKHEQMFLITNGINQYEAKRKGIKDTYDYALKREKSEREKIDGLKFNSKSIPDKLYYKKYCNINEITVWLINGEMVRDLFKTDFIEGGNSEVYKWIPKNEIWIEKNLKEKGEIDITILHEYIESTLMKYNRMNYNKAHPIAAKVDWHHRGKWNKSDVEYLTKEKALAMAKPYLSR
jgi:hypothetical protein